MPTCTSKFVGQKIRKIRWCPQPQDSLLPPNKFATGSWDEKENEISLWSLAESTDDELEPKFLFSASVLGDVTELKFIDDSLIAVGCSSGSVALLKNEENSFHLVHDWTALHSFGVQRVGHNCPCTSLDVKDDDIVSVGEDGRIVQLNAKNPYSSRVLEGSDISSINSVLYLNQFEVITANMRGQLKVWDLRSKGTNPRQKFMAAGECISMHCLAQHPHQHQIVASGGEDGTLYIWDLRQEKYPVTILTAHAETMLEMKFHPRNPNHLFTCSQDGSVSHWDCSAINQISVQFGEPNVRMSDAVLPESNPWIACSVAKHRLEICSLLPNSFMPVNSLDVESDALICGSDNEAIYVIPNVIDF